MRKALALAAALLVVSLISVALAQQRRISPPVLEQINRALLEGRYDDVAGLAAGLNLQEPQVVALVARASIARGKYEDALTQLRPIAQRSPISDAALEYGLLLHLLSRAEGPAVLSRIADAAQSTRDPFELARAARALQALGRPQEANAAFRDAVFSVPGDAAINTAWGDLFLEKFRNGEAVKSYQDALKVDPKYTPALLGMAKAVANEDPPQAVTLAKRVLEINPSSVETRVFLAGEALDAGRREEARQLLAKALEVNPSSLEARSVLSAVAYLEDKNAEFEAEAARILALSPRYGEVYRVVAEAASHNFRYDDAAALIQKGIALDPANPVILSALGAHLLRTGDEPGARRALDASFKADNLDPVTYNLLQMLDTLDTFTTVKDGEFVFRMPKDDAPVLADYAVALAHEAIDTMSKRYQFRPKGPFLVEIFNKHDDFAVRTAGLPGLVGALGVCFGRVVTMDSPRARPGTFQWEATLWHELAHVITLQMANFRLPRWLSEGISTYEEKLRRPEWARGQDMEFASMLNEGRALKLRDLNSAFTNPRMISIAYFEASLLVEHIVATYGDEGLHRLLRAYGQGLETDAALKAALNTDLDAMQSGFDTALERTYGTLRVALQTPATGVDLSRMSVEAVTIYAATRPGNFAAQMALGEVLHRAGDVDGAVRAFERAAVAVPIATGEDSPRIKLAAIAFERKDQARALTELQAAMEWDFDNIALARRVAALMREQGVKDPARLGPVYQRIVAIDPFDAEAHAALGRVALQLNQWATAIREFKAVVALKPVDQALAFTDLAESYLKDGQRAEARRHTLAALEVAPGYERAQNLLLDIVERRP
ncbi:MAG: tetratricopeptide repeat protein [Vicinamibacterales bacterium]